MADTLGEAYLQIVVQGIDQAISEMKRLESATENSAKKSESTINSLSDLKRRILNQEIKAAQDASSQLDSLEGIASSRKMQRINDINIAYQKNVEAYKNLATNAGRSSQEIQAHLSTMAKRVKSDLKEVEAGIGRGGVGFVTASMNILKAAPAFAVATAAIGAVYGALRGVGNEFVSGLKAVEDYKVSVATMAGFITTFADKAQQGGNIGKIYSMAKVEAKELINVLEILDAKTIASGKDLRTIAEGFIKQGVSINIQNKETQQGLINIATAAKLLTAGQNQEIQLRQEIRALAQGQVKDSNLLVKAIEPMVPNIKEQILKWKEMGVLIPELGKLFEGLGLASKDMEISWATIGSTLETTKDRILREGMLPVYNDLLSIAMKLRDVFLDSNGQLTEQAKILQGQIATAWETIKNAVSVVWSIIEPFSPLFLSLGLLTGKIASGWGQILAIMEPITSYIGGNLSSALASVLEGVKAVYYGFKSIEELKIGNISGAKESFGLSKEHWNKIGEKDGEEYSKSLIDQVIANLDKYYAASNASQKIQTKDIGGEQLKSSINILSILKETNAELDKTINKEKVIRDKYQEMREAISVPFKAAKEKGQISPEIEKEYMKSLSNIAKAENEELEKLGSKAVKEMGKKQQAYLDLKNKLNEENQKEIDRSTKTIDDYYTNLQNKLAALEAAPGESEQLIKWADKAKKELDDLAIRAGIDSEQYAAALAKFSAAESLLPKITSAIGMKEVKEGGVRTSKLMEQIFPNEKRELGSETLKAKLDKEKALWDKYTEDQKAVSSMTEETWVKAYAGIEAQQDTWLNGAKDGLDKYAKSTTSAFNTASAAVQRAFKGMEDALVDFVKTGKFNFSNMVDSMLSDLIRFQIQQSITQPLAGALGGSDIIGSIGSMFSGLFSANGNAFNQSGHLQAFANGGAFTNSIVTQPTIFPFANGTGLMGEAGPEAIMPLERNSQGKLGVVASGSKTPETMKVEINIVNKSSQPVTASSGGSKFDGKSYIVTTILEDVQGNGPLRSLFAGGVMNG